MEWEEMATHAGGTAHLATATSAGRPHVSQVATWLDGGAVWFATGPASRKARNLAANPLASLMWTPLAELYVQGAVELIDDIQTKRGFWDGGTMGYDARSFWGEPDSATAVLVRFTPASAVLYLGDDAGSVTVHRWGAG